MATRRQTWRDDNCKITLTISSDGETASMELFVKMFSEDTFALQWNFNPGSENEQEYIENFENDPRWNAAAKTFTHYVELPNDKVDSGSGEKVVLYAFYAWYTPSPWEWYDFVRTDGNELHVRV